MTEGKWMVKVVLTCCNMVNRVPSCPVVQAISVGVIPNLFLIFGSAPLSSKNSTT